MPPRPAQPGTPAAQPVQASTSNNGGPTNGNGASADRNSVIRDYLERRGFSRTIAALDAELLAESGNGPNAPGPVTRAQQTADEYAARNAPAAVAKSEDALRHWRASIDFSAWETGLQGLYHFVHGSLDIHRAELLPILLPVFVHIYLDLVLGGEDLRSQADSLFNKYSKEHEYSNGPLMQHLQGLRLPAHVFESEWATRWRSDRYLMPLSERGWGLLNGWLQGAGFLSLDNRANLDRGRDKVLAIINERIKIQVAAMSGLAERTQNRIGLESEFGLPSSTPTSKNDRVNQQIASASAHLTQHLKLGQPPRDPKLEKEINRFLEQNHEAPVPAPEESTEPAELVAPELGEGPPYPPSFRVVDVKREVEKVREARKRIRLGPEAYSSASEGPLVGQDLQAAKQGRAAKPSVCLFTMHDTGDSMTGSTFSDDSTLLATGFSDSSIKLWNLKGEKFRPMQSNFDPDKIQSSAQLKKLRQRGGSTTVKLIGHSGPVYGLSFDPLSGPGAAPKYLLSSSQDATVRLWSLDTYTNVVAYRGHREPVWDVQWGPKGVYFATASRDRTARIWSTEHTTSMRMLAGHLSDVDCVRFHPNSLYVATGSSDRTCRLWDVQRGNCVRVFTGHQGAVNTIAMSPCGRYLASAADDLDINLWDLGSGKLIKTMRGHTSSIQSLAFSQESAVLLSGSLDCTVRVWDVEARHKSNVPNLKNLGLSGDLSGLRGASALSLSGMANTDGLALSADGKTSATLGLLPKSAYADEGDKASPDLLATLLSKRTPLHHVGFTQRNLGLAIGSAAPVE